MFLAPLLLLWVLVSGLAGGALLLRGSLPAGSWWRHVLLGVAVLLSSLVVASCVAVLSADSLW